MRFAKPFALALSGSLLLAACGDRRATRDFERAAGVPDVQFSDRLGAGFVGPVDALALQADGKILVGGRMSSLDGAACSTLVRLNADGSRDATFALGTGFNDSVVAVAVQSDGKILVGGGFTSFDGHSAARVARLESDGSFDAAFQTAIGTGFDATVNAFAIAEGGEIFVGGAFANFNGNGHHGLVKLDAAGAEDATFATNLGGGFDLPVNALGLRSEPAASICAGGSFTDFDGSAANRLACLDLTGVAVSGFLDELGSGFDDGVLALAVGTQGELFLGGFFATLRGGAVPHFASVAADGRVTATSVLNAGLRLDREVTAIARDPENNLLLGGAFRLGAQGAAGGLLRMNAGGTVDEDFRLRTGTGFDAPVQTIAVQSDGKVLVGGEFATFQSLVPAGRLLRLE